MKRAFAWLKANNIDCEFHDYKKSGADASLLDTWSKLASWETLLNTRGTTWRKLTDGQRADMNERKALQLMLLQPSLIKRPVLAHEQTLLVGFDEAEYCRVLGR